MSYGYLLSQNIPNADHSLEISGDIPHHRVSPSMGELSEEYLDSYDQKVMNKTEKYFIQNTILALK